MPISSQRSPAQVVLLDTNILDYAFKPHTRAIANQYIREELASDELGISEYLRFEIYRGLAMVRIPGAKSTVDSFVAYPVDKQVLDIAAALASCYERDEQTKGKLKSYSDGDIILAATAMVL